jgi:mannan endo-1,4-beta-mannosidase
MHQASGWSAGVKLLGALLFIGPVLVWAFSYAASTSTSAALHVSRTARTDGFIERDGTRFMLDGKPFFVAGVNNHYLTFGSKTEVTRVLDDAVSLDANVVRTFLQPVIGSPDGSTPTIWNSHARGNTSDLNVHNSYLLYWDSKHQKMAVNDGPDGMQKVDFLIAEAKKRNLRLIIAFADFWAYTGGAQQMRAWYGSDDKNAFFFQDPRTQRDFKYWVSHVLTRINPLTQLAYRDDPTIFAWDLMNEPNAQPAALRDAWISTMSAYVKSLDQRHLVSSGQANVTNSLSDLAIPTVDFGTWHGYPAYYNLTPSQFNALITKFCHLGKIANKPVLLEEFGYARSHPDQADVYRTWLTMIANDPDCAGWVIWRLVSLQDNGSFPLDRHDQFDVHADGGRTWQVLKAAAASERAQSAQRSH